jgi:hypothetical protein
LLTISFSLFALEVFRRLVLLAVVAVAVVAEVLRVSLVQFFEGVLERLVVI